MLHFYAYYDVNSTKTFAKFYGGFANSVYLCAMIPNELIKETIFGEVVGKANHYQAVPDAKGGRRIIKDAIIRDYERRFISQCKLYRDKYINARFALYIDVYFANPLHDLDNSIKTILDCLQYCNAIKDDRFCMEIHASKHHDPRQPRVVFALKEYELTINF